MADYDKQREFQGLLESMKHGNRYRFTGPDKQLYGRLFEAAQNQINPHIVTTLRDLSVDSVGYLIVSSLTTGDIELESTLLEKGEQVLNAKASNIDEMAAIGKTKKLDAIHAENGMVIGYNLGVDLADDCTKTINVPNIVVDDEENAPVVSDGKSSSYYNLPFNKRLTDKLMKQIEAGEQLNIETGDVIELMFGNDFDFGNIEKALRRIHQAKLGKGKAGTDIKYDINKCRYFLDEIENKL